MLLREDIAQLALKDPRTRLRVVQLRHRIYFPTVLLSAISIAFAWNGFQVLHRARLVSHFIFSAQNQLAGPIVIGFVVTLFVIERKHPAVRRPVLARGHIQDACYFLLFVALTIPWITILGVGISSFLVTHAPWLMLSSTGPIPRVFIVGAALVAMDGCNWLTHLAHHKSSALWRVHAIHHTQEELSVLTTFRAHPLVHTSSSFMATLPVIVLTGFHPFTPLLITFYLMLGALPHTNVRWTFGPIGKIVASPAYHRIHHRLGERQDVNLGIVLVIWDVMARRAIFPKKNGVACETGIGGRPIRIEQSSEPFHPLRLLVTQLVEPFSKRTNSPTS